MPLNASAQTLRETLQDARARTLALIEGLSGDQWLGPRYAIVNPFLWEIGHVAWFHERFILRNLDGRESFLANADELYDSSAVAHDSRWELPLPSLEQTLDYMTKVQQAMLDRLSGREPTEEEAHLYLLTIFHEDMHDEAFTYTRQTLGYAPPRWKGGEAPPSDGPGAVDGEVSVPGGTFDLGATGESGFLFDNEKWAHPVTVDPFRMDRGPVTHGAYLHFVEDGGYTRRELWDEEGWAWREQAGLTAPVYWRRTDGGWEMRRFDRWVPLPTDAPVVHVSWHEARAYCRWAGRRLPTEVEWELAASCEPSGHRLTGRKRRYPWGDNPPADSQTNLDGRVLGCVDTAACPDGDSAFGCRQMLGNVWEWTASTFQPYPGFTPDAYKDYSQPWFGTQKVLRGGSWATRRRMVWNTMRNFFSPKRNDIFAGFRTCAVE